MRKTLLFAAAGTPNFAVTLCAIFFLCAGLVPSSRISLLDLFFSNSAELLPEVRLSVVRRNARHLDPVDKRMTKAKAVKKGKPAPSTAVVGVGAAYEFRADSAVVADMLDLDASAANHMLPTLRGVHKVPSTSVRLEAARLRAVRALGDDFRVRCAALGPKTFAYYENWLWAARAEMADAPVVPVLPLLALTLALTPTLTLTLP